MSEGHIFPPLLAVLGMATADIVVIIGYFAAILAIGLWSMRRIRNQEDYFLGGRRFGKVIQVFASFGQATSSENVVATTTVVSKNGAAGVWAMLAGGLFALPTMWFWSMWFRRVRLTTLADIFEERFNSKSMAGFYTLTQVVYLMILAGTGLVALSKTMAAIAQKPEIEFTIEEKAEYAQSIEMLQLENRDYVSLSTAEKDRLDQLRQLSPRREFSYIDEFWCTIVMALIVLAYAGIGGLEGAFITDLIQGLLMLVLSVLLLPFAAMAVNQMYGTSGFLGPFTAMHRELPESHFEIFGSAAVPELTWYWIAAFALTIVINVAVQANGMVGPASAKDDYTARYGWVVGLFLKRYATVLWGILAMFTLLLYGLHVQDADYVWGQATRDLLGKVGYGLVGLMVACLMAALMSTMSAHQMCVAALLARNIYVPLVRATRGKDPAISGTSMTGYSVTDTDTEDRDANAGLSESHMLWAGRIFGVVYVLGAVLIATTFTGVFALYKFMATFNSVVAASFWLGFLWRRANRIGAWASMIITFTMTMGLSFLLPFAPGMRTVPFLLAQTDEPPVVKTYNVRPADITLRQEAIVEWDRLNALGQATGARPTTLIEGSTWEKTFKNPPMPVFWSDKIEVVDGQKVGRGYIKIELVMLHLLGWDLSKNGYALNETLFILVRVIVPFAILMIVAKLTRPEDPARLDRFYVKMRTKVNADPVLDAKEMELSYADPHRFDHMKMFPKSNWEMRKWDRDDWYGVFMTIAASIGCVVLLWLAVTIGKP